MVALTDQFEEKKCKNSRVILPIRKTKTKTITISQYIFIQFEKKTDYFQFFHYIQISSVKKLKNWRNRNLMVLFCERTILYLSVIFIVE